MKEIRFNAVSPFQIGDVLMTIKGEKKIKEIVCLSYASDGRTEFRYQFEGKDENYYQLDSPTITIKEGLN